MKRIALLVTVALVMALMLAIAASAMAQTPPPPNCEAGQEQAAGNAIEQQGDLDKFNKHRSKGRECLLGIPPGEQPPG
jgi:hypothetical protein